MSLAIHVLLTHFLVLICSGPNDARTSIIQAINYLPIRPDLSATTWLVLIQKPISPNPSAQGWAQSTFSSQSTMISRFRSQDPWILHTPPAVHHAIYDQSGLQSANSSPAFPSTGSSERLAPKASKGPTGLPEPMKQRAAISRGSERPLANSPRSWQGLPAWYLVQENSLNQSAFCLRWELHSGTY
jgi:hypothetical protein